MKEKKRKEKKRKEKKERKEIQLALFWQLLVIGLPAFPLVLET